MLVLTRRVGEVIYIGEEITVTVVDMNLRSGFVRLGIEAPADVLILRRELAKGEEHEG